MLGPKLNSEIYLYYMLVVVYILIQVITCEVYRYKLSHVIAELYLHKIVIVILEYVKYLVTLDSTGI